MSRSERFGIGRRLDCGLRRLTRSAVALATPFSDGALDLEAFSPMCERQVRAGTRALVVCGSTGEGSSLTQQEHGRAAAAAVEAAARRVPVIAGCGAPSTSVACMLAASASRNVAVGLLCSAPPYVKPTQDGIIAHARAIAMTTAFPVMLYDVPSRVGVAISDITVARLFEAGLIAAIKDASGDLGRPARLRALCGDGLVQMTGEDASAVAFRAVGGRGCVSVAANVAPSLCARLHDAWDRRDVADVSRIDELLAPLHDALFGESNRIPLKAALSFMRLSSPELRLPLTRASPTTRNRLAEALARVLSAEAACCVSRMRPGLVLVQ